MRTLRAATSRTATARRPSTLPPGVHQCTGRGRIQARGIKRRGGEHGGPEPCTRRTRRPHAHRMHTPPRPASSWSSSGRRGRRPQQPPSRRKLLLASSRSPTPIGPRRTTRCCRVCRWDNLSMKCNYGSYVTQEGDGELKHMTNWLTCEIPKRLAPPSFNADYICTPLPPARPSAQPAPPPAPAFPLATHSPLNWPGCTACIH